MSQIWSFRKSSICWGELNTNKCSQRIRFALRCCKRWCSGESEVKLKRSVQFKICLGLLLLCIIGFQFQVTTVDDFFVNPVYICSIVLAILLVIKALGYTCQKCSRNQIVQGFFKYRLPTSKCYNCGHDIDQHRT